jgi:hypothetical protein
MAKSKRKKSKVISKPSYNLTSIENSRVGGAIALTGFDYQCLYSCYTLLKSLSDETALVRLEGFEDIDTYILEEKKQIQHIQVKYSESIQDASYLKSILKNFLEVYLYDISSNSRTFVLIYDFDIADGYFKKLVNLRDNGKLDNEATEYWINIIKEIKENTPNWNWERYCFEDFLKCLKFERVNRGSIQVSIETMLIERYDISTNNEILYARSLFYLCFSKMKNRESINKSELDKYILEVREDISRGAVNPAVHWIKPIDFRKISASNDGMYYEGKKAGPSDIVAGLPVPRPDLENKIKSIIKDSIITIIKSSSGQGKTTLAWRVAFELSDNYSVYLLSWCMDTRDLDFIVEYIRSRIKVGEIPLIVLDNLDAQLKEWNLLAQLLQMHIGSNYRLLITTRESDWYLYSGDQSNLRKLQVLNIDLDISQAHTIFNSLASKGRIHPGIINWQSAWEQIKGKGLLIEYIYLLTHGEMLADRIAAQMKEIESQPDSKIKLDLLRKVCFADTIGIQLSSKKLSLFYTKHQKTDVSIIIKYFEKEFLITEVQSIVYISGLHPVRSQHLLDFIHQFYPKSETVLDLLDIVEDSFISKLYANLPLHLTTEKEEFYQNLVCRTKSKSYQYFVMALRGLFSGSVYRYYQSQKNVFDEVNQYGGLFIFNSDINPYSKFEKFDTEIHTIASMCETLPKNQNFARLKVLIESIDKFNVQESDYYLYAYHLHAALKELPLKAVMNNFPELSYWLVNINTDFNLVSSNVIERFWKARDKYSLETHANLMLSWYLGDESEFLKYVEKNKTDILSYLKRETHSVILCEQTENRDIHVEYFLLPSNAKSANTESMNRLNLICKFLPIYDTYSTVAIRPKINSLENINSKIPDESLIKIPRRNLIIAFHQEYQKLWSNTILSNYEAPTVSDWLAFWNGIRQDIVALWKKNISIISKKFNQNKLTLNDTDEVDGLCNKIITQLKVEYPYPRQSRPFESTKLPEGVTKIKNIYFPPVRNHITQMAGLLMKVENDSRLAIINLRNAKKELHEMQALFRSIIEQSGYYSEQNNNLENSESACLDKLLAYNLFYLKNSGKCIVWQKKVDNWMAEQNRDLLTNIHNAIQENNLYSIFFEYPVCRLDDGILFTLPLILDNIDLTDNDVFTSIVLSFIPISNFEIDYIILILRAEKANAVRHRGIRISKDFLLKVKRVVDEKDYSHFATTLPPLQIEITQQMLDVFSTKYVIELESTNLDGYDVLFERLWEYSQYRKYFTQPEESSYLNEVQEGIKLEIISLYLSLNHDADDLYLYTSWIKTKVLEEDYFFGNEDFNRAYNLLSSQISL